MENEQVQKTATSTSDKNLMSQKHTNPGLCLFANVYRSCSVWILLHKAH